MQVNHMQLNHQETDPDAMLARAKAELSNNELAKAHSQFKTVRKHSKQLAEDYDASDKKAKGTKALSWLFDKKQGSLYQSLTASVASNLAVEQTEKWKSEKQMLDCFSLEEFQMHLASSRILWQECPTTAGVYQYKDTQDWEIKRTVNRTKDLKQNQSVEAVEDEDEFQKIWGSITFNKAAFVSSGTGTDPWAIAVVPGKGSAKGGNLIPGVSSGKGGKGLGQQNSKKGGPPLLMLQDGKHVEPAPETDDNPQDETTLVDACVSKIRKAMNYLAKEELNLDELVPVVRKSKYSNKTLINDLIHHKKCLGESFQKAKKVLLKSGKDSDALKVLLVEMATVVKGAIQNMKEAKHVCKDSDTVTCASKAKSKK